MRLLVSVSNDAEASSALAGGADIIDAKDPLRGALGPVSLEMLRRIRDVCGNRAPLTAAMGDAGIAQDVEKTSEVFSEAGAVFVKIGFAGMASQPAIEAALDAAIRGVRQAAPVSSGVIAVAYADADRVSSAQPQRVLAAAARAGAAGILLDTVDKAGPGLRTLMPREVLSDWIAMAREAGLMVALAGQLSAGDIDWLGLLDIDIVGVRGAACEAGRSSTISAERVSMLRARLAEASLQQRSLL